MNTRKTRLDITYEGVNISNDIAPFLLSATYTDSGTGRADDLQLQLADRDERWKNSWFPSAGSRMRLSIVQKNWNHGGDDRKLECGLFSVDTVTLSGPPETVRVKATALPSNSKLKSERVTKAWEKVTLKQIAQRIADAAEMKMIFETDNVTYDRIDQTEQTNIAFLDELAAKEGATVKVTEDTIVLYDDRKYESVAPVRTIVRGSSPIISHNCEHTIDDSAYAACQVTYTTAGGKKKGKRTITGVYRIPGSSGPTLKINERVESEAEATMRARKALRRTNRDAWTVNLTMVGDIALVQGVTVMLDKFGAFDGKYFVQTATHMISSGGYVVSLDLRKVLGY